MTTKTKKALIQIRKDPYSRAENDKWWSGNCGDAARGLSRMGYQITGFLGENVAAAPLDKRTVVKGSIGIVRKALYYLGCPQPENLDIPESLRKYTNRKIWETTLGEVRKKNERVFIKPLACQKAFQGHIFRGGIDTYYNRPHVDYETREFKNNLPILAAEPVQWRGEWRTYVLKGEILGVRNYGGYNNSIRKHLKQIRQMVSEFKEAPAAYAMDVGLMEIPTGKPHDPYDYTPKPTVLSLVEVNEGFSLGNYGISSLDYARMVEARWREMVAA
jgi:hypothetical protein